MGTKHFGRVHDEVFVTDTLLLVTRHKICVFSFSPGVTAAAVAPRQF